MGSKALPTRLSSGAITGYSILQTPNLSSITAYNDLIASSDIIQEWYGHLWTSENSDTVCL